MEQYQGQQSEQQLFFGFLSVLYIPLLYDNGLKWYAGAVLNRLHAVKRAAAGAVVAQDAAVELQDVPAARLLVEAVDVLGNDRFQLSGEIGRASCREIV